MKRSYLFLSLLGVLALSACGQTQGVPEEDNTHEGNENDNTPVEETPSGDEEEIVTDNFLPENALKSLQGEVGFLSNSVERNMLLAYNNEGWIPETEMTCYDYFYISFKGDTYIKDFYEFFDEKTSHTEEELSDGDHFVWYVENRDNVPYMSQGEIDITNSVVFDEVLCRLGTNQHMYYDDYFVNPFDDVSRYNFVKDEETGYYVCTSSAIANKVVNSLYFYEIMFFTAEQVAIEVKDDGEVVVHATTDRSITEDNLVGLSYNFKYSGAFEVVSAEDYDINQAKYLETDDSKALKAELDRFNSMDYIDISIESSVEGWNGMEYVLARPEKQMPYLYPKGYDFGYYENVNDEGFIYRFDLVDGKAVSQDGFFTYPRPEGTYYFSDITSISSCFDYMAPEVFEYVDNEDGTGYYQTIDTSLRSVSAEELAPCVEFKFDFESISTISRISFPGDGSMQLYCKITSMSGGDITSNSYTITYKEGDASDITFDTSIFNLEA